MEKILSEIKFGKFHIELYIIIGLFLSLEYINSIMLYIFLNPILKDEWNLNNLQVDLITSMSFLGLLLGSFIFSPLSDQYGRLYIIKITTYMNILISMYSVFINDYISFAICRFIIGLCTSGLFISCYTLFAEIFSNKTRAKHLIYIKLSFTLGTLLAVFFSYITLGQGTSYHIFLLVCCIPNVFMLFFINNLPNSPRYLYITKQYDLLNKLLKKICIRIKLHHIFK